jgi:sterol 24-C-methyltransferase
LFAREQASSVVANVTMPSSAATVFVVIALFVVIVVVLVVRAVRQNDRYRALKKLCQLDAKELDAYFASYGKIFDDNTMISTLDDFQQGQPPSRFSIAEDGKPSEYTAECYNILNYLCALGNVKKMYIPKCIDPSKSLVENQDLQEAEVAERLRASSDSTLLELGCGCGRIAHHMTQLTDCKVYGVNIDETQLHDARAHAKETGCTKTHFLLSDFNDPLPFDDATIDGIYSFGGFLTFVSDYDAVFTELHRVLKPGGRIVLSDGVLLDAFDRTHERHLRLMSKARMVMAGGVFLHYKYAEDIATMETFGARQGGNLLGFVTWKRHFDHAAEIHVMAVRESEHRQGLGRRLMRAMEVRLRDRGVRWAQVKTLGPSHPDEGYRRTRACYEALGYEHLVESDSRWPGNPSLQMIKRL